MDQTDFTSWMSGLSAGQLAALDPTQLAAMNLNAAGGGTQLAGSAIGAVSHLTFGLQAQQAGKFQSAQLRQNADATVAAGQRTAFDIDRATQLIESKALATAAASGGASDPTVINVMARIAAQGAYQKASALYTSEDKARLLNTEASAKDYEGKVTNRNAELVGGAQLFGGATSLLNAKARGMSLYQRFSGGGPGNDAWSTNGPGE